MWYDRGVVGWSFEARWNCILRYEWIEDVCVA